MLRVLFSKTGSCGTPFKSPWVLHGAHSPILPRCTKPRSAFRLPCQDISHGSGQPDETHHFPRLRKTPFHFLNNPQSYSFQTTKVLFINVLHPYYPQTLKKNCTYRSHSIFQQPLTGFRVQKFFSTTNCKIHKPDFSSRNFRINNNILLANKM